jgi:predicted Fe-Mo cluster-binding NifX family protein
MRFAIPLAEGILTMHFGHAKEFAIIDVEDAETKKIKHSTIATPPPHAPGVLPKWLKEQGVDVIIAGGMGASAIELLGENGIKVITGAPTLAPETLVQHYLDDTLLTTFNACNHKHGNH